MACTAPQPYLIPFLRGRPKRIMDDTPIGQYKLLGRVVYLPCGNCIACRRERRQDYTCLQMLESLSYDDNWFITLTYDEEHLPSDRSLHREHLSQFFESLRKFCKYHGYPCRYFAVGEYGDKYQRPHYHFSLFGMPLKALGLTADDSEFERTRQLLNGRIVKIKEGVFDENGNRCWHSPVIGERWLYGNHQIYRASRYTFQYVAGYVTKKLSGLPLLDFRKSGRLPPFSVQSRPSIGFSWWQKHYRRLSLLYKGKLVNDAINVPGMDWRIPRICMKWLERYDPGKFAEVHNARLAGLPPVPDRVELRRKRLHDEYGALRAKQNNTHKEINT